MKMLRVLLGAALLLSLPSATHAQVVSGAPRVQGVGDANRGDPVNVRVVACNAGTCSDAGGTGTSSQQVQGNTAAGTTDAGNPLKIGGVVQAAAITPVTAGQRVNATFDRYGNVITQQAGILAAPTDGALYSTFSTDRTNPAGGGFPQAVLNSIWNGSAIVQQRGDATGTYVVQKAPASLATGQVSIGTTSTQLVAARAGRSRLTVSVLAANTCAFGNSGVTASTGYALQPVAGATHTFQFSGALFAACSATTSVAFSEEY